jgi:hypothetical protein
MTTSTNELTASGMPAQFADLEPFAGWILENQPERYGKRLASTMEEMQAFYDAAFARFPDIIEYCNQFSLDDMPEPARKMMFLAFSIIEVSFPVECWRQPRVPDSGSASMDCIREHRF